MDSARQKNASSYNTNAQAWEDSLKSNVAHKYLEKPAMNTELPDSLVGKTILSIGVGTGDELKDLLNLNPSKIIGIDISKGLLNIASKKYPSIEFKEMDMMDMSFQNNTFDFIYSSLALHYSKDWDLLLSEISRVLKNGGTLLFSTHNPSYWNTKPDTGKTYTNERGVTLKEHTALLAGNVEIIFYNHPNQESIKDALQHAGFNIESFFTASVIDEKVPGEEIEDYNSLKEKNAKSPYFLIVRTVKT